MGIGNNFMFGPGKVTFPVNRIAGGWLADAEFSGDQKAADAVFDEVAVDLRGEVFFGLAQPGEDLQATGVG